jgi:membrane protease YdiL (CAAX protease family)
MRAGDRTAADPLLRVIAWSAVIVASALPMIIWLESGHGRARWLVTAQCVILVVAAIVVLLFPRLRVLSRFLLALAAMRIGWHFVAPWIGGTDLIGRWSESADWRIRLFIETAAPLTGALLMSLTLIGSGMTRRDLFLCRGNLSAPAQPIPFLGLRKPISWTVFGPALLVVFGVALPLFLYFTIHPDMTAGGRIVRFLPWILLGAAINAANEEFQFRNVLLAHLRNVVSPAEAVLLTTVLFGLGHYYGQPSGPIGVVMAGFAGWIWARSMIETRGSAWAFFIHMVQDVVIFSFLASVGAN